VAGESADNFPVNRINPAQAGAADFFAGLKSFVFFQRAPRHASGKFEAVNGGLL
jgi:hypothetical protein